MGADHHGPPGADFTLYAELAAVSKRPYADLVLVDDWALAGQEQPSLRADGDTSSQWESLSRAKVCAALGRIAWVAEYPPRTDPRRPNPIAALAIWREAAEPESK